MSKPLIIIVFLIGVFNYIYAQNEQVVVHSFSNVVGITLEGGLTNGYTDFIKNSIDFHGRGLVDFFFYSNSKGTFGLRLFGGLAYLRATGGVNSEIPRLNLTTLRTRIYQFGGGYSYIYMLNKIIHPYLFLGISYVIYNPKGNNNFDISSFTRNKFVNHDLNYNAEIGTRFLIEDYLSINLGISIYYNLSDNLDGVWINDNNDFYSTYNFGISYYFLNAKDSDGDGIDDSDDLCPNTPAHVNVDKFGCPLDSDKDGVPDNKDICPNTPPSIVVDDNGCPIDLDEDGIPDCIDKCLNTPKNINVDDTGCPTDEDEDGIPDYLDKCPNTPAGTEVNINGCPVDTDKDGVPDYLDNCPATPQDVEVNKYGCPLNMLINKYKKTVINKFAKNSSTIPSSEKEKLDNFIAFLKAHPNLKCEILGYTDNYRSYKTNYVLSVNRAIAVLKYFIKNGLERTRFRIKGMSYLNPIADNELEYGRALNRRVEINILNYNQNYTD